MSLPRRIEFEDFLGKAIALEGRSFGTKGIGGLDKGRDGISGRVAFQMQFADGIMNTPVAR